MEAGIWFFLRTACAPVSVLLINNLMFPFYISHQQLLIIPKEVAALSE